MKLRTYLLMGLCVLQLGVVGAQVYRYQRVLEQGTPYRFLTQIVDPYDALRGKYITLEFAAEAFTTRNKMTDWDTKQPLYAIVTQDAQGFAKISQLQTTAPARGQNYLKIQDWYYAYQDDSDQQTIQLSFPMERFYLKEDLAPQAEQRYNEANRDDNPYNAYAVVYLLDGKAVIDDVKINHTSVKIPID